MVGHARSSYGWSCVRCLFHGDDGTLATNEEEDVLNGLPTLNYKSNFL